MHVRNALTAAGGLALTAAAAIAQSHVGTVPVFNPNGSLNGAYNTLEVGLWAVPTKGILRLKPASYFEPMTITKPCTLQTTGGTVKIAPYVPQSTTLTLLSYNTHLFGNNAIPGLPRFEDDARVALIGSVLNQYPADVITLQEVWDPDFFTSIRALTAFNFSSGFYGGNHDGASILNSGLFTLSKHALTSNWQFFYNEEDGTWESMASKGYLRSVITKNGFTVAIFNTHTQSGESSGNVSARAAQLQQLAVDIQVWRALNPTHATIVAGDFNVIGESIEYFTTFFTSIGFNAGMADGGKNMPVAGNSTSCTSCTDNALNIHFNPDAAGTRLDYILYANSSDNSVRVLPQSYTIEKLKAPSWHGPVCDGDECYSDLSDHYAVSMTFDLQRP